MNSNDKDLEILARTGVTGMFNNIGDIYQIQSSAIFTKDKTIKIGEVYNILEFRNGEDFYLKRIKLLYIYLHAYTFHIFCYDIDNGDLLKFSKRLTDIEIPSPWIIVELLYFENIPDKQAIKAYCEKESNCSLKEKNDDLLELEY